MAATIARLWSTQRKVGESEGARLWQTVCRGGRSWIIAVTANGYAQIVRPGPEETSAGHENATDK